MFRARIPRAIQGKWRYSLEISWTIMVAIFICAVRSQEFWG
jgi:hypothetical protein